MKKNQKGVIILPIVIAITIILVVAYIVYQNIKTPRQKGENAHQENTQITPTITQPVSMSPTIFPDFEEKTSYTEGTNIVNQMRFTSKNLGISFLYLSQFGGEIFTTKEIGNKIYVYSQSFGPEGGQYVEVFQKVPSNTLLETMKSTFLEGYSSENCMAVITDVSSHYPSQYSQANIKVSGEYDDFEEMLAKLDQCPKPYTLSNGISYFLMDKDHSNKYVFVSVGQYAIMANSEENLTWQDTIIFLD